MTDEFLARSLLNAGLLTREQIVDIAGKRHPGEKLAQAILRLGILPPGEVLRFDPQALDAPVEVPAPTPQAPPAPVISEEIYGSEQKGALEGDFWIEGGQDENAFDPTQAPIVRWANELLKLALSMGASDLHLEPSPQGVLPRYRVDGQLRTGQRLPVEVSDSLISRLKVVGGLDITESRLPQDGRFRAHYGDRVFDFRVSTLPSLHGEKIVLRVLDHSSLVTDLKRLGYSAESLNKLRELLSRSHGMLLVTGPTGSGKTTTLYAALASARDETKNVVTVEDPVEYELPGVTQTSVESDIGLTFATALRAILRQDPDVILVGEIRDEETADVAVRAALTGHLLLATLHTNSAIGAVTRLQDMGVPPYLLASALVGVVAQRLVRLNCRHCRVPIADDYPAREEWAEFFDWPANTPLWRGQGCVNCNQTGLRGRVAVSELLEIGADIRRGIIARQGSDELRHIAREEGFRSLIDDARDKVVAGHLSPDEAMRVLSGHEE